MASSDGGVEGDNRGQQPKISEEMNPVLKETVVTTDNSVRPTDISSLNDYVMAHLFSYLSLTDLKTCRLVNRAWNRFSNQTILKRDFAINLQEDRYIGDRYQARIEVFSKLVQLISTSFQFPWTKFQLDAGKMTTMTNAEEKRQFDTLLCVISPFVTEIEISDLRDVPHNLEYPNLRKLILWYGYTQWLPTGASRNSLLRLVERASKLKDIDIIGDQKTPLFMELLEVPNCRKITRLSLCWWIEGSHLLRLSEMGLHLKYLELGFNLTKVTAESVKAILQSQSTCLEYLELTCDDDYPSWIEKREEFYPSWLTGMECPRMEKLKTLSVPDAYLYSHISYQNMFPALKKLKFFTHDQYPKESFFNDNIEPVESVEHLTFGEWSNHPETVLQAARQFPKLRSIFLAVSRNVLNIVGLAMPQLEEMEFLFNEDEHNMDAILTGLLTQEVEALKGLPSNQLDVLEKSKQPVHFLKNLKKLRICSSWETTEESLLTDFGCRFALLKMEHLEVLELERDSSQISEQVMERLRNQFVVRLEN